MAVTGDALGRGLNIHRGIPEHPKGNMTVSQTPNFAPASEPALSPAERKRRRHKIARRLYEALLAGFTAGKTWEFGSLNKDEQVAVAELADKYRSPAWNESR